MLTGSSVREVLSLETYTLLIQNSIQLLRGKDGDCLYNIQKKVQETKHHYSKQRRPSGKGKPFMEIVHAAKLDAVLEIGILEEKINQISSGGLPGIDSILGSPNLSKKPLGRILN